MTLQTEGKTLRESWSSQASVMDGDDDLFAVFDAADENTEDKPIPSSTSTEKKVWTMDLVTNTVLGVNDVLAW